MLSRTVFISRLAFPSTSSSSFLHCSKLNYGLPKVKPHYDEMPEQSSVSEPTVATPILDLNKRKPRKKEVNLIVGDSHLREWTKMEPKGLISAYLQLSKSKLTMLITSTALAGCFMTPVSISMTSLAACTAGTALLSSAANACNQLLEAPYDAQMRRTQSRVLVVHRFSPLHALSFAGVCSVAGYGMLHVFCNPLTAALGALNLFLYAGVYTPSKRMHIGCTWAGAVVGAIPPMMGYAAAAGTLDLGAACLALILYSWQFPHFNGLSWNLRGDYSKAGYRVMCVTDEKLCRVTSLRHSVALVGLCSVIAPLTDLTTITFALDSIPLNAALCYLSYKFYKAPDAQNSRKLFFFSLLYLPLLMILMVVSNTGRNEEQKKPIAEKLQNLTKYLEF
ncbi:unnamed protein product [Auanema sp. JU1783]|nr:unnamed protein product [Auanema sp. JU1783]